MQSSFFLDPIFRAFATQRPFATMTQMVLRRMLDPNKIDQLFEQQADFATEIRTIVEGVDLTRYRKSVQTRAHFLCRLLGSTEFLH